jgi:hypothetical protein
MMGVLQCPNERDDAMDHPFVAACSSDLRIALPTLLCSRMK